MKKDLSPMITFQLSRLICRCRKDCQSALSSIYHHSRWVYDYLMQQSNSVIFRGRQPVVMGQINSKSVIVKLLHHGGLLASISRDRFISPARFENHLLVSDVLAANGIQTPQIEFISFRKQGLIYRGEIGVEFIENGIDASQYLFGNPQQIPSDWEDCLSKIAQTVSQLHLAQVYHPDLNLMNFLYTMDKEIWLLDLDKATVYQVLSVGKRRRNRQRLERSIRKQGKNVDSKLIKLMLTCFGDSYEKHYG